MNKVRILSIDGGGIRGIIPLKILAYIEAKTGKRIHELFHVMGGTSTGGIIALGLNSLVPNTSEIYTVDKIMGFYTTQAGKIFKKAWGSLEGLAKARYEAEAIEQFLKASFGEHTKLSELPTQCDVFVFSYALDINTPIVFSNLYQSALDTYIWEAARATSAAPVYFPAFEYKHKDEISGSKSEKRFLIDGGICINNPAMYLLAGTRRMYPESNQLVVSLGTGTYKQSSTNKSRSTIIDWIINPLNPTKDPASIFTAAMHGTADIVEDYMMELLAHNVYEGKHQYYRFQSYFSKDVPMDGISQQQLDYLQELGDELIREHQTELDELCAVLSQEKSKYP